MNLSKFLESMKNLPDRFSNLAFWRGVRKLKDEMVKTFEYVEEWGNEIENGLSVLRGDLSNTKSQLSESINQISDNVNELKGDLNELVVKTKSKNLFDNSDLLENTRASVNDRQVTGCLSSNWIDVEQNETYTLSNREIITTAFVIGYLNDGGDFLEDSNVYNISPTTYITITIPSGYSKVRFGPFSKENASKIEKCQFEKGSVATEYVPFGYSCAPNDSFFKNYKSAFDSIYNGNGYSVGNILAIKRIEDGKPVEFEYVEEKEYQSADNSMITEHGKNLYNYKNDTFGKYADETGGSTLKLRRSEFIPVESDTDYFITGSLNTSFNIIFAEFSGNTADSLIKSATITLPSLENNTIKVQGVKITTSSTTKYIRFSTTSELNNDVFKDSMIIKGAYGIEYEPYYEFAKYDPLHPANPWRGKRLWVDGDSITHAYESNYWQFNVAKALDMILDTSVVGLGVEGYADGWKGIGGSTISNEAGNNDPEHSIVLRYMNYPDSGIDLVIIAAGTNDWGHGNTLLGDFDSLDNTTFNGALNILLPALKEKYPTIPVVIMTPIKRGVYKADNTLGLKLEDFVDALIVKCRQYGIYCCDMYANCPIDPNITSMQNVLFTRTSADGSKDLVHPGPEGHKVMGRTVTGFIRSIS